MSKKQHIIINSTADLKRKQITYILEIKNIIFEIKNSAYGLNSRSNVAEGRIKKL